MRTLFAALAALALMGGGLPVEAATFTVSTVGALNSALGSARSGDHIVVTPGTYNLTSVLNMNYQGVTLRGATGNFDDVVLVGGGMNTRGVDEGICMNTSNLTVSDLTLKDFYFNAIHTRAENNADNLTIQNVKTWNIGERHIKGSRGSLSVTSDNVLIENCYMLQTIPRTGHPDTNPDYIGGIDAMGINNWTIRGNVAEGICGQDFGGNAAIFLWSGVSNVTIENNVIIGTSKGIALGNPSWSNQAWHTAPWHAQGVTIRNNFVLRGQWTTGNNIGLELCNVKNVDVLNNTFYSANAGYFRNISVQDNNGGGATTNLNIRDNIIRGGVFDISSGDWSAAALAAMGNIVDTTGGIVLSTWFTDASRADFHLTELAALALDSASLWVKVPTDIDGHARPYGSAPDKGADEWRLVGDVDLDLDVDFSDYQAIELNFGVTTGATWSQGDFDFDGDVDFADYQALENNFGRSLAGLFAPAVPEPGVLLLLGAGAVALLRRR